MRILVTAASKHGTTAQVADHLATRFTDAGFDVDRKNPEDVASIDGYDAVVCGSAVYMTRWMPQARQFLRRFADQLRKRKVWAFSVGISNVLNGQAQDPSRIGPVLLDIEVVHHQTFAGRYQPTTLSLRERSIARLAGAVEGDFRDWDTIDHWADSIIQTLEQ